MRSDLPWWGIFRGWNATYVRILMNHDRDLVIKQTKMTHGKQGRIFFEFASPEGYQEGNRNTGAREQTDSKLPDLFSAEFVATQASL